MAKQRILLNARGLDDAVAKIKEALQSEGYAIVDERNIPYGYQFRLRKGSDDLGVLRIYHNKRRETTLDLSQIQTKSGRDLILSALSHMVLGSGRVRLPYRAYLRDEALRAEIKNILLKEFSGTPLEPYSMKEYFIRIDGLAISQYKNGTLLIQGKESELADRVVSRIQQIISEFVRAEQERFISSVLPERYSELEFRHIKEILASDLGVNLDEYVSKEVFQYLFARDRAEIADGIKILTYVKQNDVKLWNYAVLVRPFAIAFEGFLVKLLWELGYSLGDPPRIGYYLTVHQGQGRSVLEHDYQKVFACKPGHAARLWGVWQTCRNDLLHSDPRKLARIDTLHRAEQTVHEILNVMQDTYDLFKELLSDMASNTVTSERYESVVGIDEAGKGDYFGPLVVAAVCLDRNGEEALTNLGVTDSKRLSDDEIRRIYPEILAHAKCVKTVVYAPIEYNAKYDDVKNLNVLLAEGHAAALEHVLEEVKCDLAISDKFGDETLIKEALFKRGRRIKLLQITGAEMKSVAVAAASIVARYLFLEKLAELSDRFKIVLPKGAGDDVDVVAVQFVRNYGFDQLKYVAKLHFRNTARVREQLQNTAGIR